MRRFDAVRSNESRFRRRLLLTMTPLLIVAGLFLALSNGANDNFKGLATVWGSHALSYRRALLVATVATLAGGLLSVLLAGELVRTFSGSGLVPDGAAAAPGFMLAVAIGAGFTVMAATRTGMPVSTTHALLGGLIGAGIAVAGGDISLQQLGGKFVLPLLVSPIVAGLLGLAAFRFSRSLRAGGNRSDCVCLTQPPAGVTMAGEALMKISAAPQIVIARDERCDDIPAPLVRVSASKLTDHVHLLSAASICFARGVNDAPKIAALLLGAGLVGVQVSIGLVTAAMAIGGLLLSRRVAETMSLRLNHLDTAQGLSANLITAGLVLGASNFGLPVSTTHVSVGSISGTGIGAGTLEWPVLKTILLSWIATLPAAAMVSWIAAIALA